MEPRWGVVQVARDAGFWSRRSGFESLPPSESVRGAPASEDYWQVVVLLLPVPGGVQSVSREMCQPESEMSNR